MNNGGSETSEENSPAEMTVRQWISTPGRLVDRVESLHIFRQILDYVDVAHVQGVSLRNIRPSCFILSPFNRVTFIDSAETRSNSDRSPLLSSGRTSVPHPRWQDDASPESDTFEPTSRQAPGGAGEEGNWSSAYDAGAQRREDGAGLYHTSAVFSGGIGVAGDGGASSGAGDALAGETREVIVQSWGVSNSATSAQEWSGNSGSELSANGRASSSTAGVRTGGRTEATEETGLRSGSQDSHSEEASPPKEERFPLKQMLLREQTWYSSPEELMGGAGLFAADIYCLGVLFFELLCAFSTEAERVRTMADLRHRVLPPRLISEFPKEAAFCLWLLHPEPNSRPKASEVLQCELLSEAGEALAERQAAANVEDKVAESDVLLEVLLRMQHGKQDAVLKLTRDVRRLTCDIEEVERRRSFLKHRGHPLRIPESGDRFRIAGMSEDPWERAPPIGNGPWATGFGIQDDRKSEVLGKRSREEGTFGEFESEGGRLSDGPSKCNSEIPSKSAHLMNSFAALEKVYFSMRWKAGPSGTDSTRVSSPHASQVGASSSGGCTSSNLVPKDRPRGKGNSYDSLGSFFDSFCKYARYSRFEVKATVRHGDLMNVANMVCSLSFDRDEEYFATAGFCKQIKIFECDAVLNEHLDIYYPEVEMTSRSKLSSVCWNSYIKSHLASSDYDGTIQLWDASTSQVLMQYEEHDKRAWSVDFSRADPMKLASGSDDGCVKLWSINQDMNIGTLQTGSSVCCVQFPPDSSHLLVFGSADYKIYCYDLRTTKMPLCVLAGHDKAVSYVKFIDPVNLVSASTDNTLKLWDLKQASTIQGANAACSLTYTGHLNEKNFAGLSVADGYIACGSEKNSVFAYHKSLPIPMALHKFGCADPITGEEIEDDNTPFVSSVCWRGKSQTLVAANSTGNINVLEMV